MSSAIAMLFLGLAVAPATALVLRETTFDLSNVRFVGRWYAAGSAMQTSWGPGVFEVRFRGSSRIAASISNTQSVYHVCQVDGDAETRQSHESGVFVIASDLAEDQEHIIRCGRSNEGSYGETTLSNLVLDDGAEILPPVVRSSEIKYEAIGDSITAGFAVMEPPGSLVGATLGNSDVFQTYERYLADAWGTTDWHAIARSGISVTPYDNGGEVVMGQRWPCRGFYWGDCVAPWDFSSWQADVVTINLGTNDFVFGSPSGAQFQAAYADLISSVRSKHPNSLIACLAPLIYSCFGTNDPKWQVAVTSIQNAVSSFQQQGDEKVRFYATGTESSPWLICSQDYSDYTHPTTNGNKKFAARLFESTLTQDIKRFFPEKCVGAEDCGFSTPSPTRASSTPMPTSPQTITQSPSHGQTAAPSVSPNVQPQDPSACMKEAWAQCGGAGFDGDVCCPIGMLCKQKGEWWSQCEPCDVLDVGCSESPLDPTALPTLTAVPTPEPFIAPTPWPTDEPSLAPIPLPVEPTPSLKPTSTPASSTTTCPKNAYGQCDGQGFTGDKCCPQQMWCDHINVWWSQCTPCDHKWSVSCSAVAVSALSAEAQSHESRMSNAFLSTSRRLRAVKDSVLFQNRSFVTTPIRVSTHDQTDDIFGVKKAGGLAHRREINVEL